jgi:signal transduction histidine kinase
VDEPVTTSTAVTSAPATGGVPLGAIRLPLPRGLSARLLLLTLLFVLLAEVLIFLPSIANFRVNWLTDRLTAAHLASLAAEAVPGGSIPPMLQADLLRTAQVTTVAIRRDGQRRMVLAPERIIGIDATYDLRMMPRPLLSEAARRVGMITDSLKILLSADARVVRVIGQPRMAPPMNPAEPPGPLDFGPDDFVEIIIGETQLRRAMITFGLNVLGLSLIISAISAALVYLALNRLLVSPMMRITRSMLHFSENPEDASRIIKPSARTDEIGTAERELAHMQGELTQLLRQKSRLAQLGLAVSKINHDLRNILASAQLMSDRLGGSSDPVGRRFQPKLIASLDRAIRLCNNTLKFGRAEEAAPARRSVGLRQLADEVGEGVGLPQLNDAGTTQLDWANYVPAGLNVEADPEQLFRILNNLVRNAVQAIEAQEPDRQKLNRISVAATRFTDGVTITVSDTGPGVPARARATLFQAFQTTGRQGGSGLGLAIAAELVAAHGGRLTLLDTGPGSGATFQFTLPDAAA